jgi:hypothetical protein
MGVLIQSAFYTYTWMRQDGTPYYVGKGTSDRAFVHHRHGKYFVPCPADTALIITQAHPSEAEAFAAEQFLIELYGRKDTGTGLLRNRVEGHRCQAQIPQLHCKMSPTKHGTSVI